MPFNKSEYASYGSTDEASLAPLVEYEAMALVMPDMAGGVIINPSVSGPGLEGSYKQAGKGVGPVPMKIAIRSGKVHVDLPTLVNVTFEGTVLGDPKIGEAEFQEAMQRIEELQAAEDAEAAEEERDDEE